MSEDSLSDDSNLSSTSLVNDLIQASLTEVSSFTNLTFEEKFEKIRSSVKTSFLNERDPTSLDSYDQAIEEFIERTARDRKKSFHEGTIPKLSERGIRKRTFSRPNMEELRIPMMSKGRISKSTWSEQKSRRTGYVGELLNYMDNHPVKVSTRHHSGRRSSVHLTLYKKRLEEENLKKQNDQQLENYEDEGSQLEQGNEKYTNQQKEIIEEVLGDIPKRRESVFVPYGKLSYQQAAKEPTYFSYERKPSYDEHFAQQDLTNLNRILPSLLDVNSREDTRHSIWERELSFKSTSTLPKTEEQEQNDIEEDLEKSKRKRSIRFSIT